MEVSPMISPMKTRIALIAALGLLLGTWGCPADDDDSGDDDTTVQDDDDDDDSGADDDDSSAVDADGDGYTVEEDCDDANADVHPGAEEICDDIPDNDCDGIDDETDVDADGDGYSECGGDCNEYNAAVFPGAEQTCFDDILDNDCDSVIDANETDGDSDGYTDCEGDCDDTEATVYPGLYDPVDGLDNDCDGDTDEDTFDCATAPTSPVSERAVPGARGYKGIALDQLGNIVGSDGSTLIQADYTGSWSPFSPGFGAGSGMIYLPDGDLAAINGSGALVRINPAGIPSQICSANGGYGLAVGPDEMLYMAGGSWVRRVDPVSGSFETICTVQVAGDAHTVAFSGDGTQLYIGTVANGEVFVVDLDENYDAVGPPELYGYAGGGGWGGWHDGLVVDACGGIFVADYYSSNLYRIPAGGGPAELFLDWPSNAYGHYLAWGTGVGGWPEDALYAPQPYNNNNVTEIVVGIPPAHWGGTVYNGP
jgi:hypothetical protein